MRHTKQKLFEFRFVGICPNFDELKNLILSLPNEEWNTFTHRQKNIVGHKDTLTIPLLFDYKKFERKIEHPHYDVFKTNLQQISQHLSSLNELSEIKRANIVLLKAKSSIAAHVDKGDFLQSTRRIHIPITTNENCYFIVEKTKQHLKESEMWEINNTGKYHSVHNEGDSNRIHLVVDIG